jgi:DNA-binding transcriptional LysR family regulator
LAALQIQHPGLEIELSPSTRSFSLVRRETDIALRLNVPSDGTVKARRLCEVGYGLYASADVFAELHDGKPPRFITFDEVNNSVPEAVWVMKAFPGARVSFRVSDLVSQGVGAAEGCGVALLPHFVAATVPGLVRWMPPETPPTRVLWMITRPDAESGPHINAVALAVAEMVRADAGYFNPDGMALEAGALLS